jgi:hypothetical protein
MRTQLLPSTYILTSDPFHKIIRASGRCCCLPALPSPGGSSPFADDANVRNPFFFSASFSTFSASYMEISARLYQNLR